MNSIVPILTFLAAGAYAKPFPVSHARRDCGSAGIQWGACAPELVEAHRLNNFTYEILCAEMEVPLDYNNIESNRTHILDLIRVPAQGESLGNLILNFGGPGEAGVSTLALGASTFIALSGGQHDLISWDPRGTSSTRLTANCTSAEEWAVYSRLNPVMDVATDSSRTDAVLSHISAAAEAYTKKCGVTLEGQGEHMGTAATARDVMRIVDGLGDEKLNFWGMSYGTPLGATLAMMFPDRMGRMVYDAVVDPYHYYENFATVGDYSAADAALRGMLDACVEAGPEVCPFNLANNVTGAQLEEQIYAMIDEITERPMVWPAEMVDLTMTWAGQYLDGNALRNWLVGRLYSVQNFPIILDALAGLLEGDVTRAASVQSHVLTNRPTQDGLLAIYCSDRRVPRDTSIEALRAGFEEVTSSTRLLTSLEFMSGASTCAHWPFEAAEIYRGSFELDNSENPFLIVGNTRDPVTPFIGARRLSEYFRGSALVEFDTFGHGMTNSWRSPCIIQIFQNYLINGTVPAGETVCENEYPLSAWLKVAYDQRQALLG